MTGKFLSPSAVDALLLGAIAIYQRLVSPRKGYRCAYGVLHGGAGCSGAVRDAIQAHGWRRARRVARSRFRDCKLAAQVLRAQSGMIANSTSSRNRRRRREASDCACDSGLSSCFDFAFDCGPADKGCIDCNSCDCNPCN